MVEEEGERAHRTEVAAKLVEDRTDVAHGAGGVVGEGVHKDSDAVGAVALVGHGLIVALVFTHRVFDGAIDVVFRHVLALGRGNDGAQGGVHFGFRAAGLNGYGNLLTNFGKCTSHVAPALHFSGLTIFKCSSHGKI